MHITARRYSTFGISFRYHYDYWRRSDNIINSKSLTSKKALYKTRVRFPIFPVDYYYIRNVIINKGCVNGARLNALTYPMVALKFSTVFWRPEASSSACSLSGTRWNWFLLQTLCPDRRRTASRWPADILLWTRETVNHRNTVRINSHLYRDWFESHNNSVVWVGTSKPNKKKGKKAICDIWKQSIGTHLLHYYYNNFKNKFPVLLLMTGIN